MILAIVGLSSCNTTQYLGPEERLLVKNDIKFLNTQKFKNKGKLKYELSRLYKQTPNSNFFFIPREWFHYRIKSKSDTSKFDRWVNRVLAEKPAIFDKELTDATVDAMSRFMNYRGYFNAEVYFTPSVNKADNKIRINYYVDPGQQLLIDTTYFLSRDSTVEAILRNIKDESLLKSGAGMEGQLYERERDRITRYLRNHGYAFFLPNYVAPLDADTTVAPNRANLYLEVLPPYGDSLHQAYTVGSITIYPNFDPLREEAMLSDTIIYGVRFRGLDETFEVKPQTIIDGIYLQTGALFRQENFEKTNRSLSSLGVFRFVRIKQEVDSLQKDILNFRIELTTNPKIEVGVDFALSYTNRSTASAAFGNLIGIGVSPSIRHRNMFQGAEVFVTNISAGVEVNPSGIRDSTFWNTVDLQLQTELSFPRFNDYLGLWRLVDKLNWNRRKKAAGEDFYTSLQENAATRLSASFNYLLLLDFYRYNLFNANYGFDLQRSNNRRYIINHLAIDYLRPRTEEAFDSILASNPFLERSFGQQLFVSLLFRDFNMLFTSRPNRFGESHFIGTSFEVAGAEIWAANKLYNAFAGDSLIFKLGTTEFSQYLKGEADFRYYRQLNQKNMIAGRFAFGLAVPFGFTSDVPYVKQFYVGGPSSIRGWPARSLGPGGYEDVNFGLDDITNRLLFYQTGDIKLEFSLEYRFDLFWLFKGALFLDGGNVWTLREDPDRCGSQFRFSAPSRSCQDEGRSFSGPFYRQIALGTGFGLRLDLSYFIFRLDMGLRLRSPFPLHADNGSPRERDFWTDFSDWNLRDINYNIGLGYPF